MSKTKTDKKLDQIGKRRGLSRNLFVFMSICALILLTSYGFLTYEGRNKSLPRLRIDGFNVSSKTKTDLNTILQNYKHNLETGSVSITFRDQTVTKQFKELGVQIDQKETSKKIYSTGKIRSIFPSWSYLVSSIRNPIQIEPEISWINTSGVILKDLFKDQELEPQNPKISMTQNSIVIEPEKNGIEPDYLKLRNQIEKSFLAKSSQAIIAAELAVKSNVKASDIEPIKDKISGALEQGFIVAYANSKRQVPDTTLIGLIDVERTGLSQTMTYSDQEIENYLKALAAKINIKAKDRIISSFDNSVIDEGQEGLQLDITQSEKDMAAALSEGKTEVRLTTSTSPIEDKIENPAFSPGKYPGKYIEVNLTDQMLYAFEGTNLVGSYKVSTGKWSMPTPIGEYTINNKDPRAYSQEYGLYMPYWMSFIGSQYGIHELPEWPDGRKEGEGHLGTPVSHGCVRLGRGSAETVYNWAEIGTIVYIHE